jgi:hypothetical protein
MRGFVIVETFEILGSRASYFLTREGIAKELRKNETKAENILIVQPLNYYNFCNE